MSFSLTLKQVGRVTLHRVVRGTACEHGHVVPLRKRFGDERCVMRSGGSIRRKVLVQEQDVQRAHSLAKKVAGDFRLEREACTEARTERATWVQRDTSEICGEAKSADRLASAGRRLR